MKMDCYPRFKKSPLVKECLLAEMEGKPLPINLPQEQQTSPQQQSSQFMGIWKKYRVSKSCRGNTAKQPLAIARPSFWSEP